MLAAASYLCMCFSASFTFGASRAGMCWSTCPDLLRAFDSSSQLLHVDLDSTASSRCLEESRAA